MSIRLLAIALLVLAISSYVSGGVLFISKDALLEGGGGKGSTAPVVLVSAGLLGFQNKEFQNLFIIESLYDPKEKQWEKVAVDVKTDGVVGLLGHGGPSSLAACKPEDPATYAKFLAPLKGLIKEVHSFGCLTGQKFVGDLQKLLAPDNKGVVVYGPDHVATIDPKSKGSRIMVDDAAFNKAVPIWLALDSAHIKGLGAAAAKFDTTLVALYGEKDIDKLVVGVRAASIAAVKMYEALWLDFLAACDKDGLLQKPGAGMVKKAFFFRQLFKHKRAARNQLQP